MSPVTDPSSQTRDMQRRPRSFSSCTQRARRVEGGFGLIELLVVLVIIGVLGAIVMMRSSPLSGPASTADSVAACRAELSTIETAVQSYRSLHGSAPASITDLTSGRPAVLPSWPTDANVQFSMPTPGVVMVSAPIGSLAQSATSPTACAGAGPRPDSTSSTSATSPTTPLTSSP